MVVSKEELLRMTSNGGGKQKLHLAVVVTLLVSLVLVWMPMYKVSIWGASGSYALYEMDAAGLCWIATGLNAVGILAVLRKSKISYLVTATASSAELIGAILMLLEKNNAMKSAEGYLYQVLAGNIKMTACFWLLFVSLIVNVVASILLLRLKAERKSDTAENSGSTGICPKCGGLTENGICPCCGEK